MQRKVLLLQNLSIVPQTINGLNLPGKGVNVALIRVYSLEGTDTKDDSSGTGDQAVALGLDSGLGTRTDTLTSDLVEEAARCTILTNSYLEI